MFPQKLGPTKNCPLQCEVLIGANADLVNYRKLENDEVFKQRIESERRNVGKKPELQKLRRS